MSDPTPRQDIFDLYWYFASERQRIFERRLAGEPAPWTDDPILATYKFCNVFRAADRVSQYMIQKVACGGDEAPKDRMFQITAFRTFSRPTTWDALTDALGHPPRILDLASGAFEAALDVMKQGGATLYTGAFILCATDAYGRGLKHRNHAALFRQMFVEDGLATKVLDAPSLHAVYDLLHTYPLMGDFMSYQTAVDLNYSELLHFSENDFVQCGPGALRGIRKAFCATGERSPEEVVRWMVDRQQAEFARLGLPPAKLFGRPLHAIDAQGLFCELDKYCRVARPELASGRVRIKAKFQATPAPIRYTFPPQWGITATVV